MSIVGNNTILTQYAPTFLIKNLKDGQSLVYDVIRKAFINTEIVGGGGGTGVTRLDQLLDVNISPINLTSANHGQALVYNSFSSLWENTYTDYNTLLHKPSSSSFSFAGLSDTAKPSLPSGYVLWNSTGTQLVYSPSIPVSSITGLASVATTGDYGDLINVPLIYGTGTVTSVDGSGGTTGLSLTGGPFNQTGTLTLGGILSVSHGGTGSGDSVQALTNLLPSQTNNHYKVLTSNGFVASWELVLPSQIGNAGKVLTSNGSDTLGNVAWMTPTTGISSLNVSGGTTGLTTSGGPITTSGTITLAGVLGVSNGGTGIGSNPAPGQIDIGNGTGFTRSTLTAGTGMTITNSAGGITLTSTSINFAMRFNWSGVWVPVGTPPVGWSVNTSATTITFTINGKLVLFSSYSFQGWDNTDTTGTYVYKVPPGTSTFRNTYNGTNSSITATGVTQTATGATNSASPHFYFLGSFIEV
jgi:hypothetical protein